MKISKITKLTALSAVMSAGLNGFALIMWVRAVGYVGLTSDSITVGLLFALLFTAAVDYTWFVYTLRKHFQQEAEDKLFHEIEQDQPRRFGETNFK